MALTQISTAGVKDDAVTSGKIPANAVGSSELADNAVDTAAIADQAVTLAKLPHGTSSNNGKFLRANNGADPSFETVSIPAGTTINNNADNRVITGSGTANTLNSESTLTYSSPALKLLSSDAAPQIRINSDTSDGTSTRLTIGRATANNHFVNGAHSGDSVITVGGDLLFGVGTSEKMRLDSSGRIKINHTDHPGQLDNTFISIQDTNGGGGISKNYAMMQVNNYGTGNVGDLSGIGFGAGAGNAYIKGSIGFMRTGSYGQGDFTFNLNTDSSSALVNDTDEVVRIRKEGGITFNGDTAAANALDDYEEGTWTPTAHGYTASNTSNNCFYTKIGRLVIATFRMTWPSLTNSTAAEIRGLPFTARAQAVNTHGGAFSETNDSDDLHLIVQQNTTKIYILRCRASDGVQAQTINDVSGKDFRGNVIYFTDS